MKKSRSRTRRILVKNKICPTKFGTIEKRPVFRIFIKRKIVPTKVQVKYEDNLWNQDTRKEKARVFRVVNIPW